MQNQPSWVTFLYLSHKSSRKSGWSHGNTTQSFPLPSLPKPPSRHAFSSLWTSRLSTVSIFPTKPRGLSGKHESNNVLKWSKPSHGFPSFTENDLHFLLWPSKAWPHLPAYLLNWPPPLFLFQSPLHIPSLCSEWSAKPSCGWFLLIQFLGQVLFFQKYLTWPPDLKQTK